MHLGSQRGQTLPFWAIGVLVTLSMLFFLANYGNAITWQIRAQNAADSAATGALSVQANVYNEYDVILYSAAVDEYRIRALNQALLNTIYGTGGCSFANNTCATDYNEMLNEYNAALNSYTDDIHLMDQANNITQGGQTTDQQKALNIIQGGTWCTTPNDYACQFKITPLQYSSSSGSLGGAGYNEIDIIACKNIPYFGSALLKLGNNASYKLIGRAAAAIVPAKTESFNPGTLLNSSTGQVYQPVEYWSDDKADTAYAVNFSGLNVDLNWYEAGAIRPFATASGNYTCS